MKNTVTAKVITDEGFGIPNLVVVLYDVDISLKLDPGKDEDWGFWSQGQFRGNRIGSAITGVDGTAKFEFENSVFQPNEKEPRPDLILLVLAPERSFIGQQGILTATPPKDQIMHYSDVPRANAGLNESYLIEISRELLAKFNIQVPQAKLTVDNEKIADAAVSGWVIQKTINEKLKPFVQADFAKAKAAKEKANQIFKDFIPSRIPKSEKESPLFVSSKENLPKAQNVAIQNGLKRMKGYKAPFTLSVSKEILDKHGISFDSDNSAKKRITHRKAFDLISDAVSGSSLMRAHTLKDLCGACTGDEAGLSGPRGTGGATGGSEDTDSTSPDPSPPISLEEARREVTSRVLGQVADLKSWNPKAIDQVANLESVAKALRELDLSTGPADVEAFYDFHSLQIAFDHVWTEAYDGDVKRLGMSIFEHVNQIQEGLGFSVDDTITGERGIPNTDDLTQWLDYLDSQISNIGEIPKEVGLVFNITDEQFWIWLGGSRQRTLTDIAVRVASVVIFVGAGSIGFPPGDLNNERTYWNIKISQWQLDYNAERISGIYKPPSTETPLSNIKRIISEIRQHLLEKYSFKVFAPNSYNFGLLLTYRQRWKPQTYQVGDLIATIPLAPGESRKYTKKRTTKQTRAEKEVENALSIRRSESTITSRAQAEILRKATLQSSFNYSSVNSIKAEVGPESSKTAQFGLNISRESTENKQNFHEAVLKAAEEYKRETTFEVNTSVEVEFEEVFSGEISNPNNEIPVTYLFYELQRRYLVSEQIHKVTPVIFVAQDVPAPHEIDEAWLITHEWILRRVLLDDSFHRALDYLKDGLASDEYAIAIIRDEWMVQRELVQKIQAQVTDVVASQDILRRRLNDAIQHQATGNPGLLGMAFESLLGGTDEREVARARVEAAQSALDFNQADLSDAKNRLGAAESAYKDATRRLTEATQKQLNRRIAVNQLRAHVKDNIIYYMQAIWDHEVPDQRFFRLYDLKVDVPQPPPGGTDITFLPIDAGPIEIGVAGGAGVRVEGIIPPTTPVLGTLIPPLAKSLVEIAALDSPLGYKGNYIILPLKEPNYLTTFMAQEFFHSYFGIWDPDVDGNYPTSELVDCVECMRHKVADGEASEEDLKRLEDILFKRLQSPRRSEDMVIVPSNQLYIEALPGAHPVLEKFKLLHRAIDVSKAIAESRGLELENLRKAARLLQDEPQLDDPDIDKKVLVQGDVETTIDS